MLIMSSTLPYERTGRTGQKARTRNALIEAARGLLADGLDPSVEQAAGRASISRATAYRYFPNRRELVVAAHPEIEAGSLLGAEAPADPEARVDAVAREIARITLETEPELRAMLRLSLETAPADRGEQLLRKGRRIVWFEDAIAPLKGQLDVKELKRLAFALAAAVGIDTLVWMTDVAGLSRRDAVETMRWSARGLLRSAIAEAAKG